jgi:hypothetical protein
MIVTVFIIFLFFKNLGSRKSNRRHDNSCIRIKDLRGHTTFDTLITSIDESSYTVSTGPSNSDTLTGSSDDKARNDSLSMYGSDIFQLDPKTVSDEIRIPPRKNFTKPFRKYGQRIFTRRRRTTGR